MPQHLPVIALVAWWLGFAPLVCVVALQAPRAYWWLALALGVSWLADASALLTHAPQWVSRVYPVSQSALVAAVFLSRKEAGALLALLVLCGLAALWLQPSGPDLFLHGVAWLLAAVIASEEAPQPLRRSLTVYFGWGALAWLCYVLEPGWTSWLAYQGTRLVGICLFGYACLRPAPRLRVI